MREILAEPDPHRLKMSAAIKQRVVEEAPSLLFVVLAALIQHKFFDVLIILTDLALLIGLLSIRVKRAALIRFRVKCTGDFKR